MARLHRFFCKNWKMVMYGKGTLNTITVIVPDNFEGPCSESLICICFKTEVLLIVEVPQVGRV